LDNPEVPDDFIDQPVSESIGARLPAELIPERARVRPRVFSPESGEALPLEDELWPLIKTHACGAVRLTGPPGSGATTALRHLASLLPPFAQVTLLDNAPQHHEIAAAATRGLVVYASHRADYPRHLATYHLAPWGDDELIEYLLATDKERCASVMARLKGTSDREIFEGIPEIWQVVLDRMLNNPWTANPRAAICQELAWRLANPNARGWVRRVCFDALTVSNRVASRWVEDKICRHPGTSNVAQLVRHRPVQILVAADRIAEDLAAGGEHKLLQRYLPHELVLEAGSRLSDVPGALDRLKKIVANSNQAQHAMAASLLHAAGIGWRPKASANGTVPWLFRAHLKGADWPRIDLAQVALQHANLSGANLSRGRLDHATLTGAFLQGTTLSEASLQSGSASGANFSDADLRSCRANRAHFAGACFARATLSAAMLNRANFLGADLREVRAVKAHLAFADLNGANIEGADFSGANLEGAQLLVNGGKLSLARFAGARFGGAKLSGCDLEGMELPDADFEDAELDGALLTSSSMPRANFLGADLRRAGLAEIDWPSACLRDADLCDATFHLGSSRSGLVQSPIACEGSRTGFYTDDYNEQDFKSPEEIRKANLRGADLRGATIDGVDFYLVDLRGAQFNADQAEHFRRCGAILDRG
jgi:uncharacterized protein YjbI with pentapeptide repeats